MDERRLLRELSRDEALRLLAEAPMGRVVFTQRALASATAGEAGAGGDAGTVVAYEADSIDTGTRTGWSVVVTGMAGSSRTLPRRSVTRPCCSPGSTAPPTACCGSIRTSSRDTA